MTAQEKLLAETTRYRVNVEEYRVFRNQGFVVVRGLVPPEDVQAMNEHVDNLLAERETIDGARV